MRFLQQRYGGVVQEARRTNGELMAQLPLVGNITTRFSAMSGGLSSSAAAMASRRSGTT